MRILARGIRSLRFSLLTLAVGLGVYFLPVQMGSLAAQEASSCDVDCGSRGSCSASGPNCTCTCSTFLNIPSCSCTTDVAPPAGGG